MLVGYESSDSEGENDDHGSSEVKGKGGETKQNLKDIHDQDNIDFDNQMKEEIIGKGGNVQALVDKQSKKRKADASNLLSGSSTQDRIQDEEDRTMIGINNCSNTKESEKKKQKIEKSSFSNDSNSNSNSSSTHNISESSINTNTKFKLPSLRDVQSSFHNQNQNHGLFDTNGLGFSRSVPSKVSKSTVMTSSSTSTSIPRQSSNDNRYISKKEKQPTKPKKFIPPQLTSKRKNINTEEIG